MALHLAIRTTTKTPISKVQIERFIRCTQKLVAFPTEYDLSVVCVGETAMRNLQWRYRSKLTATNVLSFPYDETSGEVVLCIPVIQRQAKAKQVKFPAELLYLLSHGLLHLVGFDHVGSNQQAKRMERLEQRMLRQCCH